MSQPEPGHGGVGVERTLALIKPDAVHKAEEIEELILKSGFTILQVGALTTCNVNWTMVNLTISLIYLMLDCIYKVP